MRTFLNRTLLGLNVKRAAPGWIVLLIAIAGASCERRDPLSMIAACFSSVASDSNISDSIASGEIVKTVECEIDRPVALLFVPRPPVSEAELRAADFPVDAVKALADSQFQAPAICVVAPSGRVVGSDSKHSDANHIVHSQCLEARFEISHPLVVRGRKFTFLLGHSNGKFVLAGVKFEA